MPQRSLLHGGVVRWLAAGSLLVVSGWFATSHAVRIVDRRDRALSQVLGGDEASLSTRLFEGPNGLSIRLDASQRSALERIVTDNPLDGTAIAIAALDRAALGDAASAKALSHQALRVQPRTRLAWLARLARQMRERRTIDATNSTLRLLEVDPPRYAVYLPILAALTRDRRAIAPIAAALKRGPAWGSPFLGLLTQDKFDPAIRYALMNPDARGDPVGQASDKTVFVTDLINRGDMERAYLAWISFLPDTALRGVGTPYDATFAGLPGPAPFNWQLNATDGERASLIDGALDVSYSGRDTVNLAHQVVLLSPGSYRIASIVASGNSEGPPSDSVTLTWRLSCLPGNTPIGNLVLNTKVTARRQVSPVFAVPDANCGAVSLALVGQAAEFPVRVNARLASVMLEQTASPTAASALTPAPLALPSPSSSPNASVLP